MTVPFGVLCAAFALSTLAGTGASVAERATSGAPNQRHVPDREASLLALLRLHEELGAATYVIDARTAECLAHARIALPAQIAREHLGDFVALQLFVHDLVRVELGPLEPSLWLVRAAEPPSSPCLADHDTLRTLLRSEAPTPAHR